MITLIKSSQVDIDGSSIFGEEEWKSIGRLLGLIDRTDVADMLELSIVPRVMVPVGNGPAIKRGQEEEIHSRFG